MYALFLFKIMELKPFKYRLTLVVWVRQPSFYSNDYVVVANVPGLNPFHITISSVKTPRSTDWKIFDFRFFL